MKIYIGVALLLFLSGVIAGQGAELSVDWWGRYIGIFASLVTIIGIWFAYDAYLKWHKTELQRQISQLQQVIEKRSDIINQAYGSSELTKVHLLTDAFYYEQGVEIMRGFHGYEELNKAWEVTEPIKQISYIGEGGASSLDVQAHWIKVSNGFLKVQKELYNISSESQTSEFK